MKNCKNDEELKKEILDRKFDLVPRYLTVDDIFASVSYLFGLSQGVGEIDDILRSAAEYCKKHDMELSFTSPGRASTEVLHELGLTVPMCGACLSNMAIAPDGSVVPCQSWLSGDAALGNILTDRFETVWNHPLCKKLRSMSDAEALSCPFRTAREEG